MEAQTFYLNRTQQDVINTVASQYLTVLLDRELLRIARENYEAQNKQLILVSAQVELGAKSPVEQYNQDSQTKAAKIRAIQAEVTELNDRALLTQTLLLDPIEDFDVQKPEWDVLAVGSDSVNLDNMMETALSRRGDYLRAQKNEVASKYAMRASRGNMMPTLTAFASISSFYNYIQGLPDSINSTVNHSFENQFKTENVQKQFGVQLSIPIFNNFQYRTTYVQQRVNYMNNQQLRKNAETQVKTSVYSAYQNFTLAQRTYMATLEQFEAAEAAFQMEQERYNLGVTSFVEFANATRALVQAQTDKAQAEYRLIFQKVLVDYALGTLKPEDIASN